MSAARGAARLHDIADARLELEELGATTPGASGIYRLKRIFIPRRRAPRRSKRRAISLSSRMGACGRLRGRGGCGGSPRAARSRPSGRASLLSRSALPPPEGSTFSFGAASRDRRPFPRTGPASCRPYGARTAVRSSGFVRSGRKHGSRWPGPKGLLSVLVAGREVHRLLRRRQVEARRGRRRAASYPLRRPFREGRIVERAGDASFLRRATTRACNRFRPTGDRPGT